MLSSSQPSSFEHVRQSFNRALESYGPLLSSAVRPWHTAQGGFALSYCFEYDSENVKPYSKIAEWVGEFEGPFTWLAEPQFNGHGLCLRAIPRVSSDGEGQGLSSNDLRNEAERLAKNLQQQLLTSELTNTLDRRHPVDLSDPYDPGMQNLYVLTRPSQGTSIPDSLGRSDRKLHFAPSTQEWASLMWHLLGIKPGSSEAKSFAGLQSDITDFPLLSRISGPYDAAAFEYSELDSLKGECNRASVGADAQALAALKKIRLGIRWAEDSKSGLLFEPIE